MSTTYLNLKGSIRTAGIRYQDSITTEQLCALDIAARALGVDAHVDAIRAEMNRRLELAFAVIDNDEQERDHTDWMEMTQGLRHGF